MFELRTKELGHFDVAVCGGGIAGVCAAVTAARQGANTVLIERSGCLGGTMTEGFIPNMLDALNKGGIVKEIWDFLNAHDMTCTRRGPRVDENGKKIPGVLLDTEGAKYFFDKLTVDAGVKVLFHSQAAAVSMKDGGIESLLVVTECGNYTLTAENYIDATGGGLLADMAGCSWECGDPFEGRPSPASMAVCITGMPPELDGTDSGAAKSRYSDMLLEHGIAISAQQASVVKLPSLINWNMGFNFQYDVVPDDISVLSQAVYEGRKEAFEMVEGHKKIPGFEKMNLTFSGSHLGLREGRRIMGLYRLSDEDILEGRKFDDGVCLVTFGVDVHKLKSDDTLNCDRGYHAKPYHIPFRCLVAKECNNLFLAGRCISGDFYPHASYRVMGNMAATGEAAGFAAAACAREKIAPAEFDGRRAKEFAAQNGYEL